MKINKCVWNFSTLADGSVKKIKNDFMNSGSPFLSVLLPVFNCEKYVGQAIDSICRQTFSNFELLIADDGSSDNSKKIIEEFARHDARIKCFHNDRNIGKTATVKELFSHSKGHLITIHDADDISVPLRFEKQVNTFLKDEELGICGVSFITIDKGGFVLGYHRMSAGWEEILQNVSERSQFHGPTMMMRRFILENLGEIYRPYFRDNYEDTDLALRIIDNYKGINLEEHLYLYRILGSSLCRKNVDVRNRNLYKVVVLLAQLRKTTGTDFLMENMPEKADQYLAEITREYDNDPSRIYREAAAYYFYWKLVRQALSSAWEGFLTRPFNLKNLRILSYIIRKHLINCLGTSKTHYKEILQ